MILYHICGEVAAAVDYYHLYILSSSSLLWRQAKENSREWERQSFDIMTREYVHIRIISTREREQKILRERSRSSLPCIPEKIDRKQVGRDRVVLILLEDVSKTHTNINFEEVIFLRLDIICFCF